MKNVLKFVIFELILFILMEFLSCILLYDNNFKKYGMYKKSSYEILEEKENTIDVIALGDSLIYSSISPMEIWGNYGYTSYDCSGPAQIIPETYEYLKVAIDSQHPKVVFFEADVLFRNSKKKKLIWKAKEIVFNLVPVIKHHDNWKKLFITKENNYNNVDIYKGYKYITKIAPGKKIDHMKQNSKKIDLPKGNLEYLLKIVELCNENNVKLVLVGMPSQISWNYQKYIKINNIANNYNLEFLDLNTNNPVNIDWETDTKDKGMHLNYKGAKKVSLFLGNYLKDTNLLTDKRNDSKFKTWNDNYTMYQKKSNNN